MLKSNIKNNKKHWDNRENSYPMYPAVKHRKNFVLKMLKQKVNFNKETFLFDYGCGTGDMLFIIKQKFQLTNNQLGGCDILKKSIDITKTKINTCHLYQEKFPKLNKKCDVIICSEVIEHTPDYKNILKWVKQNLEENGLFILTTQGGKMCKIDIYSGHTQMFKINRLIKELNEIGFKIKYNRLWGFPLYSLQKYLTNFSFEKIKDNFLEGNPSLIRKIFFQIIYLVYFVHDFIFFGPQIYIVAINKNDK